MTAKFPTKPVITFDLDGVICRPPLGKNIGISRNVNIAPLPTEVPPHKLKQASGARLVVAGVLHRLRYLGRRPLDDAADGLRDVCEWREPVLVTARNIFGLQQAERWLARHGLRQFFTAVYANDTGLRGAQFKLHKAQALGAGEHVDDDGATAFYMASNGVNVFLRDWPLNRGLPYPENVRVIRSLVELAAMLSEGR